MVTRAGKVSMNFPESYYPLSVTHSYVKGARIVTSVDVGQTFSVDLRLDFPAYLVSVDIDTDTHQYPNFYTLEIYDGNGIKRQTLIEKLYDSGQKVIPMVIPPLIRANDRLRLSIYNSTGVRQNIVWHGNFIY